MPGFFAERGQAPAAPSQVIVDPDHALLDAVPANNRWKPEVAKPVEWEWVYTWGSPAFVKAGEIYRIHSGSRARAATHPVADDTAPGRKHVYAAGPVGAARLIWKKADYVRLVDAFGTVIDEVVVWTEEKPAEAKPAEPRAAR